MRWGIRQKLMRAREREAARRRLVAERPYEARRGIHGPCRFRTLYGAQGWVDANWPKGEPTITEALTGASWWRDVDGVWRKKGDPEPARTPEPAFADAADVPYWMRPL